VPNKIWFIGDSFTYGYGCRPGRNFEYYEYTKRAHGKIWTQIVSEELNMVENNLGKIAGSNPYSLGVYINNIKNFKKGDYIILGTTYPYGLLVPSLDYPIITSTNGPEVEHDTPFDQEKKSTITDFRNYFIEPYQKRWNEYYFNLFKNLSMEMFNKKIYTFIWDYKVWEKENNFESIREHTNNIITDPDHFSWNGHKQFANYILNKINLKDFVKPCLI